MWLQVDNSRKYININSDAILTIYLNAITENDESCRLSFYHPQYNSEKNY